MELQRSHHPTGGKPRANATLQFRRKKIPAREVDGELWLFGSGKDCLELPPRRIGYHESQRDHGMGNRF